MGTMMDRSMSTSYDPGGRGYGAPGEGAACAIAEATAARLSTGRQYSDRRRRHRFMERSCRGADGSTTFGPLPPEPVRSRSPLHEALEPRNQAPASRAAVCKV